MIQNNSSVQPTEPQGPTGQLCNWLADFQLESVPENVKERAKEIILDGLGCAIVGAQLPWSRVAVEAVAAIEGDTGHGLIGWDRTVTGPAAALLNGTFIQGFELDDFHPIAPLHSASLILPALFAAIGDNDIAGADFLRAAIAGFEVGPRVGRALHGAEMLSRGWHSGAVFGTHAAAASVAVLDRLNAACMEDALGLAATQSAGLMAAQYEAMCKRMHHGFSSRNGYYAAKLAGASYTGIKRVFERDYGGFLSVFGEGHSPDVDAVTAGLGETWETLQIALKPYAAMGGLHCALDIILALRAQGLRADQAERIDIFMSHAAYHHGWWRPERPLTPIGAQMNVGYAVAAALLDGSASCGQFTPQRIDSEDIWSLLPRITAHHDPVYDRALSEKYTCRIDVALRDGKNLKSERKLPSTVSEPLTREHVIAKFHSLTHGLIDSSRADHIVEAVLQIESGTMLPLKKSLMRKAEALF